MVGRPIQEALNCTPPPSLGKSSQRDSLNQNVRPSWALECTEMGTGRKEEKIYPRSNVRVHFVSTHFWDPKGGICIFHQRQSFVGKIL